MRKLSLTVVTILLASTICSAGSKYNSRTGAKDFCITFRNESGTIINDHCEDIRVSSNSISDEGDYFLLAGGGATGGYTSLTTAQTSVSVSYSLIKKAIASSSNPGFSTGTLPDGRAGQFITILITEVGAGGTWTLTPVTKTGFVSLIFEGVGDQATLLYVDDTIGWTRINIDSVQSIGN